jgi:hypothetical protein
MAWGKILSQRETRIDDAIMMHAMRSLAVYLTVLILLAVSVAAGCVASDWPNWCHRLQWCAADWPQRA